MLGFKMSPKPVRDVIVATSIFVHKYRVSMYFFWIKPEHQLAKDDRFNHYIFDDNIIIKWVIVQEHQNIYWKTNLSAFATC